MAGRDSCNGQDGYAATFDGRRTFLWRSDWLKLIKRDVSRSPSPGIEGVLRNAEEALRHNPYSVVEKAIVPPGGTKHDYYSLATYWWPDPKAPGGLPYVRRDGEVNPQVYSEEFDFARIGSLSADVSALSLAYYLTDDERYAAHATKMLRAWFLDPDHRMNPNLRFAQAVPGRNDGRSTGIIETTELIPVVESIGLLQTSQALSTEDFKGLQDWFKRYLAWMQDSDAGKKEGSSKNNHSVAYDVQLLSFALFSGQIEIAREVAGEFAGRRIVPQISADGSMPEEMARARTFHYALFALNLVAEVASLSECVGLDLWRFKKSDGGGVRAAFDFLAPYAGREREWSYPESDDETEWLRYRAEFHDLLLQAAWAYGDSSYATKASQYEPLPIGHAGNPVLPAFAGLGSSSSGSVN